MPMDNTERAHHAEQAVLQYLDSKGEPYDETDHLDDQQDQVCDLICDLLHHAKALGLNPFKAMLRARTNFLAEDQDESGMLLDPQDSLDGVRTAHDKLSEQIESPDAGNDDVRDAAISMCDALNVFWNESVTL